MDPSKRVKKPTDDLPGKINFTEKKKAEDEYPVFCFKHLQTNISIKKCKEYELFFSFLVRVQKLSELGWGTINISDRHSYGWEKIPIKKIKPKLPAFVTPEVKELYVFRYTGSNHPFLALRSGNILHVIFIEAKFGDVYNHK